MGIVSLCFVLLGVSWKEPVGCSPWLANRAARRSHSALCFRVSGVRQRYGGATPLATQAQCVELWDEPRVLDKLRKAVIEWYIEYQVGKPCTH